MARKKRHLKKWVIYIFIILILFLCIGLVCLIKSNVKLDTVVNEIEEKIITTEYKELILSDDLIYLVVDEEYKITSSIDDVVWYTNDEAIALVSDDGTIRGFNSGETIVSATYKNQKKDVKVVVTDLITLPSINNKKSYLKCKQYTKDENDLLDKLLEYKISKVGLSTRAGAVEAARFLTLEFKYRIAYFYENGRLYNGETRTYCDGEGRYYHKGLYLNEEKYKELLKSNYGPAIWGCSLYSGITGSKTANGLDCSGFVAWALYNGGFDPGDKGAGISKNVEDLSDLGEKLEVTKENLDLNSFKVGDLFSKSGHIAILIGYENDTFYIAESLKNDLHVLTMTKDEVLDSDWKYIILMDEFYKEDGNLTNMW